MKIMKLYERISPSKKLQKLMNSIRDREERAAKERQKER